MGHNEYKLAVSGIVEMFKRIRIERKLSHDLLAKRAGISRAAISHIESGKRSPTLLVCLKIAHALGVELSDIIALSAKKRK